MGTTTTWYRLAYVNRGTRLRVFEHSPIATVGPESDIMRSENIAWRLANEVVEPQNRSTASDHLPLWAHVRTGNTDGPSAGLMITLAYIDLLTPGALVGDLRVAGTGGITADGHAFPVKGIDVKVATAMLTRPDVIFTTRAPTVIDQVTILASQQKRIPADGYIVGEWLNVTGYEQAGRDAAGHPGTVPVVVVHDLSGPVMAVRTHRRGERVRGRPPVDEPPHLNCCPWAPPWCRTATLRVSGGASEIAVEADSQSPVLPSIASRSRSAWPQWRAYSSTRCTMIQRSFTS